MEKSRQMDDPAETPPEKSEADPSDDTGTSGKALSRAEILEKLDEVPMFCLMNEENNLVGVKGSTNEETCFWHSSPSTAHEQLVAAREQNVGVVLHIGVRSLGLAFSLGAAWGVMGYAGKIHQHWSDASMPSTTLRHTLVLEQGVPNVDCPVFLCEVLQKPLVVRVFLDRIDLARAWIESGRPREEFSPSHLTVMDLRMLVEQMQTDVAAWSVLRFIPPSRTMAVLEKKEQVAADDEPPPLV